MSSCVSYKFNMCGCVRARRPGQPMTPPHQGHRSDRDQAPIQWGHDSSSCDSQGAQPIPIVIYIYIFIYLYIYIYIYLQCPSVWHGWDSLWPESDVDSCTVCYGPSCAARPSNVSIRIKADVWRYLLKRNSFACVTSVTLGFSSALRGTLHSLHLESEFASARSTSGQQTAGRNFRAHELCMTPSCTAFICAIFTHFSSQPFWCSIAPWMFLHAQ